MDSMLIDCRIFDLRGECSRVQVEQRTVRMDRNTAKTEVVSGG